jgi:hypothetical protein
MLDFLKDSIFTIQSESEFNVLALELFHFQYQHLPIYNSFCNGLKINLSSIKHYSQIPFLPIEFFKNNEIVCGSQNIDAVFSSSTTTSTEASRHFIADVELYRKSFTKTFEKFYGSPSRFCILALLPSYLEREGSSLVFMVNDLISRSDFLQSDFFLNDFENLERLIRENESKHVPTLLLGVTYALLDFAEKQPIPLKHTIVMETGGMKGRRREMIREEVHSMLKDAFSVTKIHSEYGMTELLSQAYSLGDGIFNCPPWMKVICRSTTDPLQIEKAGKSGNINCIDLANMYSCAFIATQDLGKIHANGSFEVLGRSDNAEIRGCNLMASL